MAVVDFKAGEVLIKLVFEGAPGAGKATTLEAVRQRLPAACCGTMERRDAAVDKVLRFDFMPAETELIPGLRTRIRLVVATGPVEYMATRRLTLVGADGIVFTLDSNPASREANLAAYGEFGDAVDQNRRNPDTIPLVYQYNKRDLPGAAPVAELDRMFQQGPVKRPGIETVAKDGSGVLECLDLLMAEVIRRFAIAQERFPELRSG